MYFFLKPIEKSGVKTNTDHEMYYYIKRSMHARYTLAKRFTRIASRFSRHAKRFARNAERLPRNFSHNKLFARFSHALIFVSVVSSRNYFLVVRVVFKCHDIR